MINKKIFKIFILLYLLSIVLFSCKGIQIQNSKQASIEEFSRGQVMIFVKEEKNKYETAFGKEVWNIKSEKGNQTYKDYVLSNIKKYVESLVVLNIYANENGLTISSQDINKISEATTEYYDNLTDDDIKYMQCSKEDIEQMFIDYRLASLSIDQMTKNSNIELSISETKVIETNYIVVDDYETATKILDGIKGKGANFNYYANAYTKSENKNIEMIISRGDDMSVIFPEVFYLASGEVSDILEYQNRYYIFKCISDYKEKESKERRAKILSLLKNKEFNEQYLNYYESNKVLLGATYWKDIDLSYDGFVSDVSFYDIYVKYFGA